MIRTVIGSTSAVGRHDGTSAGITSAARKRVIDRQQIVGVAGSVDGAARMVGCRTIEPRHGRAPRVVVEQQHALIGVVRAAEHVADFEADAVAGSRRFRNQHVGGGQPLQIALEHLALGQSRLG